MQELHLQMDVGVDLRRPTCLIESCRYEPKWKVGAPLAIHSAVYTHETTTRKSNFVSTHLVESLSVVYPRTQKLEKRFAYGAV